MTAPEPDRHEATLDVYERRALDWQEQRPPRLDAARNFTDEVLAADSSTSPPVPGATLDLGCGPGWHLPVLPPATIAVDAAAAMLDLVGGHSPGAPRLRADLRRLPFARGSCRAVWANKSYVHLRRSLVPFALWDLHRALAVGGVAHIGLFGGDRELEGFDGDEFAGRSFSLWPVELLHHVLVGAGFDVLGIDEPARDAHRDEVPYLLARVRRCRTLADTVGPGMRLLLVGLNPSLHAADSGIGFSGPGNRGWPALGESGLASVDRDPAELLRRDHIGMTDLVKRATPRAGEISREEFRDGLARLAATCAWLRPAAVCVVGLTGWRAAVDTKAVVGEQPVRLGGRPVWLMANPSGLNTHVTQSELAEQFAGAAALADRHDE